MVRVPEERPGGREPKAGIGADDPTGVRATRGLAWSALEQWGGQAVSLVAFVVLSRLLAPSDFGLLAMAGVVVALLQALIEQGFGAAIIQRRAVAGRDLDTAFWSTVGLSLVAAGLVATGSGLIAALFSAPSLGPVIAVLAATVPLTALGATHHALLRRRLEFRPLAARALVANLVGGGVAIGIAVAGGGLWSLVAQSLVTAAVGSALLWWAVDWRPGRAFHPSAFRDLGAFAASLTGANVVNFANRYADDLIIGLFLGPVALGYYTIAYRLLWSSTRILSGVASSVAFPLFARFRDPARLRDAFQTAVKIAALVSFPIFAGMAVFAPELIVTLFGERWAPAAPVLRILTGIGLLHSIFYLNTSVLMAAGRPGWVLKLNLLSGVLNVVAFLIAVRLGIAGVAAAYVIRGYVTSPVPLMVLRRVIGLDLRRYGRQVAGAAGAAAVMVVVAVAFRVLVGDAPAVSLLGGAVICASTYTAAIAIWDRPALAQVVAAIRSLRPGPASPVSDVADAVSDPLEVG